jgi:ribosomal-protein-alanine N-acetyltransferase
MPDLYTPRLHLRLPTAQDAPAFADLMSADISSRLASWPPQLSVSMAAERIAACREAFLARDALPLAIVRRADGMVLGWIGAARSPVAPRQAVLTYWLGDAFQGHGLMREAAPAALAAAFEWLGVDAVQAAVQGDNLRSRGVLRGLGMHLLGPGTIWCAARGRDEACEWWGIDAEARFADRVDGRAGLAEPLSRQPAGA